MSINMSAAGCNDHPMREEEWWINSGKWVTPMIQVTNVRKNLDAWDHKQQLVVQEDKRDSLEIFKGKLSKWNQMFSKWWMNSETMLKTLLWEVPKDTLVKLRRQWLTWVVISNVSNKWIHKILKPGLKIDASASKTLVKKSSIASNLPTGKPTILLTGLMELNFTAKQ